MKIKTGPIRLIIFCLTACLIVPFQARAEERTAVSKDGVPISFSVYGKGEPTLIFVHGWSCNRSVWKNQVPYFEKNYRVVTVDLGGFGASGQEREVYTLKAFGQDIAAVIRAVQASKVILLGHSMGGAVIIEADQIMPDEIIALVGIDTMQDFDEEYTPEQAEEFIKPFKEDFKKTTREFVQTMFPENADPELVEEVSAMMSGSSEKTGISAMEEMLKISYIANPPKINAPVWCLNSEIWPTKPEINRKYVKEFNLRLMPGVGHFLMLESPDEFNRQLESIIKEIEKTK